MKVKERLWFIHKEFLVGLWWKLRSPNSWSNGLTTKPSLLTSCTTTLQVDVGVIVMVWTHSFSFLSLWQWAGCTYARFLVCLLSWACSEACVGKGKLKLTSWSRGFENYDLWLAIYDLCCYLQDAVRASVLWSSAPFHFKCLWFRISEEIHYLWKTIMPPGFP